MKRFLAATAISAAFVLLGGCDSKPEPLPTWEPGQERFNGTVREKDIVLNDPKNPAAGVKCWRIVIEAAKAGTHVYCVDGQKWIEAKAGQIWIWEEGKS